MRTRRAWTRSGSLAAAMLAVAAGVPTAFVAATPTAATASATPITIAYITSVTGEGASEDGTSPGAFKARIDLQNAEGGVNGHKIVPLVIDDQTSPTAIATAVQEADSKALAIVSQSPLFFLAAKYPQQAGVPVTGSYSDGPEWGEQPYTNMFAADVGSLNPKYPVTTLAGNFLKAHGAKVLGTYGYGISPSSSRAAIQTGGFLPSCGRQGWRPQYDRAIRERRLHERRAVGEAKSRQRARRRRWTTTRTSPWRWRSAGRDQNQAACSRPAISRRDPFAGVVVSAGRLLLLTVPSLVASGRGDQADAGGNGEVRRLQQE